MTLYEAIQADKRKRAEMALTVASAPNAVVEAQPIVIDASVVTALAVKMKKAENDIAYLECELEDLNTLFELETDKACAYRNAGDKERESKSISKIIGYRKRIHNAENALAQAKLTLAQTKTKLFPQEVYSW